MKVSSWFTNYPTQHFGLASLIPLILVDPWFLHFLVHVLLLLVPTCHLFSHILRKDESIREIVHNSRKIWPALPPSMTWGDREPRFPGCLGSAPALRRFPSTRTSPSSSSSWFLPYFCSFLWRVLMYSMASRMMSSWLRFPSTINRERSLSSSTAERFSEARLSSSGRFSDGPTRAIVSRILSGCPGSGDVVAAVGDDWLIPSALLLPLYTPWAITWGCISSKRRQ